MRSATLLLLLSLVSSAIIAAAPVAARTEQRSGDTAIDPLSLRVVTLTPEVARQFRLTGEARGVVITRVGPGSDAEQKGIQPGDVIVSINQRATKTAPEVSSAIAAARAAGRTAVLLLVRRGNAPPAYYGIAFARTP